MKQQILTGGNDADENPETLTDDSMFDILRSEDYKEFIEYGRVSLTLEQLRELLLLFDNTLTKISEKIDSINKDFSSLSTEKLKDLELLFVYRIKILEEKLLN